ncbi:MAG TPA: glycosyltransferase family 87 protein [Acidobacteriaceae bacterium]|jgi:hypothetical protein
MIPASKSDREPEKDQKARQRPFWLPTSLRYFLFAILGLTIVSLGYSLVARILGFGLPYSFSYPFIPGAFFSDFSEFRLRFPDFGTPQFFNHIGYLMYPAAMTLAIEAFYATPHPLKIFFLFLVIIGMFFTGCLYHILRKGGLSLGPAALLTAAILITSYPYLVLLLRWNTEVFIWLTVTLGLWTFYRRQYVWAAIWIGLAAALKLYPIIFFGLFLPRRRYLDIALGVFIAIAITVVALRTLSPNIVYAFHWNSVQLQAFGKYYAAAPHNLGYDHSLLGLVKFATLPWHPDLTSALRPFTWFIAVACLVLYFGRIWKMPIFNQILSLSVLSVSIAPVSYDYTLLSLYAALTILCVAALHTSEDEQSNLTPFFLLFAAILTPLNFIILHGAVFGAQLRALLLIALLVMTLRRPIRTEGDIA